MSCTIAACSMTVFLVRQHVCGEGEEQHTRLCRARCAHSRGGVSQQVTPYKAIIFRHMPLFVVNRRHNQHLMPHTAPVIGLAPRLLAKSMRSGGAGWPTRDRWSSGSAGARISNTGKVLKQMTPWRPIQQTPLQPIAQKPAPTLPCHPTPHHTSLFYPSMWWVTHHLKEYQPMEWCRWSCC